MVGVPLPGADIKLVPDADMRCEIRAKGPNVFAGYLNDPEKTAEAFDDEGYFKTGDAMLFVDASDMNLGLRFDGRLTEEFKLRTGTWVRAAGLRLSVLSALGDLAADAIITGADRADIGVFVIPSAASRGTSDVTEADGALCTQTVAAKIEARLTPAWRVKFNADWRAR